MAMPAITRIAVIMVERASVERVEAGEAHEREAHQTGGDHRDGGAFEGDRHVGAVEALADAGEQHQREGEADRAAEAEQQGFEQVVLQPTLSSGTPSTAQLVVISGR